MIITFSGFICSFFEQSANDDLQFFLDFAFSYKNIIPGTIFSPILLRMLLKSLPEAVVSEHCV